MKKKYFLLIIFFSVCLSSCRILIDILGEKGTSVSIDIPFSGESVIINTPTQSGIIGSIDIRSPGYFWLLRPWKKGTLATMDGKARFSEISFKGKSGMKITPLINFPKEPIDRIFVTAPESSICITADSHMFYIADITNKKTKKYMPLATWRFNEGIPLVLDPKNGIICFRYIASRSYKEQHFYNIIYDVKNDKVLYESPKDGEENSLLCPFSTELIFCEKYKKDDINEVFFYNWKTKEITRNELTKKLEILDNRAILSPNVNINIKEHYLFAKIPVQGELHDKNAMVTWDENYENVKVIPLDYLTPNGQWMDDISISADGKWASSFIGYFDEYYREAFYKRVFFHLDSRYPNGISMPIFSDDLYIKAASLGAFVEHPEYGLCFAGEKYKTDKKGKEKLYLRLYKMDDVLAEINRQLSGKTEGVLKE